MTATLSGASSQAVTLTVGATTVSPAVAGDLTLSENKTLTIAAGETTSTSTVTLTAVDNDVDAANKTFTVSADASGGNGVADPATATLTITDDDTRGVTVAGGPLTMAEVDNTETENKEHQGSYTVVLDSKPTNNVQVNISAPSMVTVSPTQLTFTSSNWNVAQTVTATAINDNKDNPGDARAGDITHSVVAGSSDYTDETADKVAVTVTDDDGEPALSIDSPSITEGNSSTTTLTFKVTLSPASGKPVSVDYADTGAGTATSAIDYAAITSGTLNFDAGQTEKTVVVTVNGDTTDEPNETVILRLSSPSNATLSGGKTTLDGTGTIKDDDDTPTVTLKLAPSTIAESGDDNESTVTATLSGASSQAVTLTVGATAVSPAVAGDLTLSENKTLTIAAGETTSAGTVTLTAVDNDVDAANKTFTVSADASGGNGVADPATATLTITDDDTRGISVAPVKLILDEVDDPSTQSSLEHQKTYTVELDSAPTGTVTVNLSSGDTKIATVSDTSLEFTASDWDAQTVTVTAVADAIDNADDERTVHITHTVSAEGTDYKDETAAPVNVTVTDDDGESTLSIDSPSVAEGDSATATMTFKVTLTPASGKAVSVAYADAGTGTATSATDYAAITSGTLRFTAGQTEKTVAVTVTGDAVDELHETIVLRLSSVGNAVLTGGGNTLDGTGTITDDDTRGIRVSPVALTLDEVDDSLTENVSEHQKTYTVELDSAPTGTVTVNLSSGDTKIATVSDTSLEFTASDWDAQTVTVTAVPDAIDNVDDERTVQITHTVSATGTDYEDEAASPVDVTVTDDDSEPTVSVANASAVDEGDSDTVNMSFTVTLSAKSGKAITVPYTLTGTATGGSDYETPASTSLSIPAGDTSGTIVIKVKGDTLDEPNETIIVTLGAPTHAMVSSTEGAGTGTITDDDATPTATLALTPASIAESGATNRSTVTATLNRPSSQAVTLTVAVAAVSPAVSGDITLSENATLTIAAGETSSTGTVTLTARDNSVDADDKTFTVSATASGGAVSDPSALTLTVTDDDAAPTVSVGDAAAVTEGNSGTVNMSFTVSVSAASGKAITVPYTLTGTATGGSDYETPASTSLSIPAGDTSGTIVIKVKGDTTDEPNETIIVTLGNPTHATVSSTQGAGTGTGTITDDDATPTATLALTPASIAESGATNRSTVTATLNRPSSQAVTLTVAVAAVSPAVSGDITLSENTTLTIAAGATTSTGVVTLTAVDNDVDAANKTFTVSAGATGGNGVENPASVTLTVTDDDVRGVTVAGGPLTMDEVDKAGTAGTREDQASYTVVLASEPTNNVQVNISAPSMVTVSPTQLTFTPSNWNVTQTVTATAVNDNIDNTDNARTGDITHALVAGRSDYTGVTASDVKVTVNDDDAAPGGITLSVDETSIAEDAKPATVTVTATVTGGTTYASAQTVTVTVGDDADSATKGDDYADVDGFDIVIGAGSTSASKSFTLDPENDVLAENTETLSIKGDSGDLVISGTSIDITDNDETPTITLSVSPTAVDEDDDPTEITVTATLGGGTRFAEKQTLEVTVGTTSPDAGEAKDGTDHKSVAPFDLTISAGAASGEAEFTLTLIDDTIFEPTEVVPVNGELADVTVTGTAVTINEDDSAPTALTFKAEIAESDASHEVAENVPTAPTITVTATLTGDVTFSTAKTVTVTVGDSDDTATVDDDYKAVGGFNITILAESSSGTGSFTFTPVNDAVDEENETVSINGALGDNNPVGLASITITDDDTRGISVAPVTLTLDEVDDPSTPSTLEHQKTYTVKLDSEPTGNVGVNITAPAMVALSPTVLTFKPSNWNVSQTVTVTAVPDAIDNAGDARTGSITHSVVAGESDYTGVVAASVAVTVTDDDGAPTLSIDSPSITEGDSGTKTMNFKVTLSAESGKHVSVAYADATTGTATSATDYAAITEGTLNFTAGETEKTVAVTVNGDELDEPNETVVLRLSSASNAVLTGGGNTLDVTGTITDDDTRGIRVSPVALTLDEVDDSLSDNISEHQETYTVELDSEPTGTVTVNLSSGDTEVATLSDTSLEFTPSDWDAQTVTVTAVPDAIDNADDERTVRITHTVSAEGTDYKDENAAAVDVTVIDDDGAPTLRIDSPRVTEGNNGNVTMTFKVTLSTASGKLVSVDYADAGTGTAISTTSYAVITSGTLQFDPGETEKTVSVTVKGDTVDELNETVVLRLSSASNAVFASGEQILDGAGTITDDDTSTVTLALSSSSIAENGGSSTVTATLNRPSSQAVTLTVAVAAVSPAVSGDITLSENKTLTIAAGATTSTGKVTITAADNDVDAANKTFTVSAAATGGNGIESPANVTLTVTDDDIRDVTVSGSTLNMAEADNSKTEDKEHQDSYTVVLNSKPTNDVRIDITAPDMVTLSTAQLTFTSTNWNQAQTVTATAKNDNIDNTGDARTGTITHTVVAGSSDYTGVTAASVAVTVNDDDGEPALSIDSPSVEEGDNGIVTMTFKVTLAPASGKAVNVSYGDAGTGTASSATDYAAISSGTLNFAVGDTEKTVAVTVNGDTIDEPNETVVLRLSSPSNATLTGGATTLDGTGTITDDDAAPTVAVANASAVTEGNSGTKNMSFTVTLSAASGKAITVPYTLTGTATGGSDYETPATTSLSIPAGDRSGTIVIKVKGDTTDEPNETIIVTLNNPTHATVSSTQGAGTATGTITDDDATPTATLALTPASITESGATNRSTVTATLNRPSSQAVTLTVAVAAVSPAVSGDITLSENKTLTIAAGATTSSGVVTLTAKDNDVDAADKTFTVSADASGGEVADPSALTLTITDDDAAPTVAVANASAVTEGNSGTKNMSFTVTLSAASGKAITVPYTLTGTATGGSDYETPATTSLSIPAGDRSGTIVIKVKGDTTDEPNETIIVTLNNPTHATVSSTQGAGTATGTITDDDATPTATLALTPASITESGATNRSTVTATLNRPSSQAVTLTVAVAAVSPAVSGDITLSENKTLTIAAGATTSSGVVTLTAKDNDVDAADKTFTVSADASGGEVADPSALTLTITDDDAAPTVAVANASAVTEGNSGTKNMSFTVTLSAASGKAITVPYTLTGTATGGSDYETPATTSLSIPAGDRSGTIVIKVKGDTTDEPNETIIVTLNNPTHATVSSTQGAGTATGTITDDDATPTATLALTPASITESGATNRSTVTATLNRPSSQAVTLTVAVAAVSPAVSGDITLSENKTLTIAAGATTSSGVVTLTAKDNDVDAADKTFTVSADASGGEVADPSALTLTITDDDAAPTVAVANASAVTEGNSGTKNMSFTVTLSAASGKAITVPYTLTGTATGGSDYETPATTSLSIPAGDRSGTIVIKVKGDTTDEPNETIIVTLNNPTHATVSSTQGAGTATGTITDDDATPTATLALTPASITESGATNRSTVTATLNRPSSQAVTLTVAVAAVSPAVSGDITLSENKTLTIAAGATTSSGVVTLTAVDNAVDAPNKTFTVAAGVSGGNGVTSPANKTLTVTDDDTRGVTIAGGPLSMAEVDNSGTDKKEHQDSYTVVLTSEPTNNVIINIKAPNMVNLSATRLTFTSSNWDQAQTVTATAINDNKDNPGDKRTGTITHAVVAGSSDYASVTAASVAVTVNDDDGESTLSIDSPSVAEGNSGTKTMTFKVTLAPASGKAVSVDYADADTGTATSATDYAAITSGTLNFAVGQTEKTVSVTVKGDTTDEPNETVVVRLSSASNAALSGGKATLDGTGTITDDDGTPTATLNLSASSITEKGGTSTVTASLNRASSQAVTLTVAIEPVSPAVAGDLTLSTNKTLTIAAGATTSTGAVTLTAKDNDVDAPNKTFTVSANASGGGVATPSSLQLTVTDDDAAPTVSVANASAVTEGNSGTVNMSFIVSLSGASGNAITVPYTLTGTATGGSDYETPASASLSIPAGDTSGTIVIKVKGDTVDEPNETIIVTLGAPTHATVSSTEGAGTGTGTITDDDSMPTLSINSPSVDEGDSGTATMNFKVTMSSVSGKAVSVAYADASTGTATSATDYTAITSGTLNFAAGDTEKTVSVKVIGDTLDESNETIVLRLSSATHATLKGGGQTLDGTGTITDDDDSTPVVTLVLTPSTINESGTTNTSTVTATLSGTTSQDVTLTVAATPVSPANTGDITLSTNKALTIAAGATTSTGTVTIIAQDNDVDAPNKAFTVSANASGGNGVINPTSRTLTITDDDGRGVTVTGGPLTMDEADNNGTSETREDRDSYTVVLDSKPTDDVIINITAPNIVTLSTAQLTFTPSNWSVAQTVTVTAVDDTIENAGDARTGTISHTVVAGDSDYNNVSVSDVKVTVNDNDAAPGGITLSVDKTTIAENAADATVSVTATVNGGTSFGTDTTVTVSVGADEDSAIEGADYAEVSDFDIVITAGTSSASKSFTLNPTDDTLDEVTEQLSVNGESGNLSVSGTSIDIIDNDDSPEISIDSPSVTEGGSGTTATLTYTVSLSAASDNAVTVAYAEHAGGTATQGEDYDALTSGTLSFVVGETEKTIAITVRGDDQSEGNETVFIRLSSPTNARFEDDVANLDASGTINDDDATPDGITLSVDKTTIAEDATTETVTVTATIDGTSTFDANTIINVVVGDDNDSATEGVDYANVDNFEIVIAAGSTSAFKSFTLDPKDDALYENTERLSIEGEPGDLTISGTAISITDNDDAPIVTLTLSPTSISENGGQSTVTAKLNTVSSTDVVLTVAVVPNSPATTDDFTLSESPTLTIAAGSQTSSGTVTITANDNAEVTLDKSISVSATTNSENVSNPNDQTLTISDDDTVSAEVSLSVSPETVAENDEATNITVTATLSGDIRFDTDQVIVVTVGSEDDSAIPGTDYEEVSSFNIVIEAETASGTAQFELTPIEDSVYEGVEQITISGANESTTVTTSSLSITDNDVAAILSVSPNIINESAGATEVTVTATMNGSPRSEATPLKISVDPGTAEVEDYEAVEDFTLTIPAEATSADTTFIFTPVDDLTDEADESVIVSGISNIDGYTVTPASMLIRNEDDRADPIILTVTPARVAEDGGAQTVEVVARFEGVGIVEHETIVSVSISSGSAMESVDFLKVEDVEIKIPARMKMNSPEPVFGKTTFTFTPIHDKLDEMDETVVITGEAKVDADKDVHLTVKNEPTLIIENVSHDISPKEWLARFGRTVAEQVLDAIDSRMHAQRASGFEINLAGVNLNPLLTGASEEHYSQDSGTELNDLMPHGGHRTDPTSPRNGINLQIGIDPQSGQTSEIRSITQEDLLMGSSFSIESGDTQEGHFALWGRATRSNFEGSEGGLVLDGEVTSVLLGADWSQGDITAGLIAGQTRGEGGYQSEKGSGQITADMTGVYPWARFELSERISIWGVAGTGDGTLTLTPNSEDGETQTSMRTDLDFAMAAAGLRGILIEAPDSGGFELAVKTDVMNMTATTAKVQGLLAADVEVTRFRLGLEGSQPIQLQDDAALILNFELGARHDEGDAETGFGVDVGAGIAWTDPKRGLSADLRGRALISHESKDFRNAGISAMFAWDRTSAKGRGPQLTISQTMGSSSEGGMDALLERQTLNGLVAEDSGEGLEDQRVETVFSYGFATFDDGYTLTPTVGYAESTAQKDYRVGWNLTRAVTDSWTFELGYEAVWQNNDIDGGEPESTVGLQFGMQW